jgi:hypothetical protein
MYAVTKQKCSLFDLPSETPMSETDVTLAWREICGLTASKGTASRKARSLLQWGTALLRGSSSRNYCTMLSCLLERGKGMAFLSKHFNSLLVM